MLYINGYIYFFFFRDFHQISNGYYGWCYTFNHGQDNTSVVTTSKYGSRYGENDKEPIFLLRGGEYFNI